jgi:hypothetical protein
MGAVSQPRTAPWWLETAVFASGLELFGIPAVTLLINRHWGYAAGAMLLTTSSGCALFRQLFPRQKGDPQRVSSGEHEEVSSVRSNVLFALLVFVFLAGPAAGLIYSILYATTASIVGYVLMAGAWLWAGKKSYRGRFERVEPGWSAREAVGPTVGFLVVGTAIAAFGSALMASRHDSAAAAFGAILLFVVAPMTLFFSILGVEQVARRSRHRT